METTEIRRQLKSALGYNARQVSVRQRHYGSIVFTVRDPDVDFQKVERFSKSFESISRCEMSGEILSGGNTFVRVTLSDAVKENWEQRYKEKALLALAETDNGSGSSRLGYDLTIYRSGNEISVYKGNQTAVRLYAAMTEDRDAENISRYIVSENLAA